MLLLNRKIHDSLGGGGNYLRNNCGLVNIGLWIGIWGVFCGGCWFLHGGIQMKISRGGWQPPSPSKTSWFYARSAPLENLAYHSETVLLCKNVLIMCHFNRKGVLVCIAYSTQFKLEVQA